MSRELELAPAPDYVLFDGERLPGTNRVRRFVALLLETPDAIVDHISMRRRMHWQEGQSASNNAKVTACHAREVLAAWRVPAAIETVYGHGYRLRVTG